MASAEDIATLRRITNEPTTTNYTDEVLSVYIDDAGSVDGAAAAVWQEKVAKYERLVNTSESGSSRSLQQIFQNAMEMAKFYSNRVAVDVVTEAPKTTYPIERL